MTLLSVLCTEQGLGNTSPDQRSGSVFHDLLHFETSSVQEFKIKSLDNFCSFLRYCVILFGIIMPEMVKQMFLLNFRYVDLIVIHLKGRDQNAALQPDLDVESMFKQLEKKLKNAFSSPRG